MIFNLKGKTATALTGDILEKLENEGLGIQLCRGQEYDNATSMAGIHGGVQQRIKDINPKAILYRVPIILRTLCGKHSSASNPSCVIFFGNLEVLYMFCSVVS